MNKIQNVFTDNKEATGLYVCAACGTPLFEAAKKFEAGCGFPSFWLHLADGVTQNPLSTYGRERIQLLCRHCGLHLGHLFPNRHTPTGVRYCISKEAIRFCNEPLSSSPLHNQHMAQSADDYLRILRENRSSESNFQTIYQTLQSALTEARTSDKALAGELTEVDEKYAAEYNKAKETGGSAWPEFEKFVTQFERALTSSKKDES